MDWIILPFLGVCVGVCADVCVWECIKVCFHLFCGWLVPFPQLFCLLKTLVIYFKEPMAGSVINHLQEMDW